MEITGSAIGKGVAVAGVSGTGGYGIYKLIPGKSSDGTLTASSESLNQTTPVPVDSSPKFLFNIQGFGTSGDYKKGEGKFGYAFGRFMLDPDKNEDIWKKNEEKLKGDSGSYLNSEFKKVKEKSSGSKDLKGLCKEMYRKSKTEVLNAASTDYLNHSIWSYCSNLSMRPGVIDELSSEVSEYEGKWAAESNNEKALISVSDFGNAKDTWEHIYKNILKKDLLDNNKKDSINSKFKSISGALNLYDTCKAAYKSSARGTDVNNYGKSVKEYCVLDLSIEIEKFPTEPAA